MTAAPTTVPDGGLGWFVVLGAFLAHVVGLGSLYTFGVLLPIIADEFGRGQGATAWVIGAGLSVMLLTARPAGRAVDRFGPEKVVLVGAIVIATGFLVASLAGSLPVTIVAFGLLVGPGMAVGFVPGVAAVSEWFDARRGLALGIAVSGSGVGTFVMAPLVDYLIRTGGWRSAMRWLAAIILGVFVLVAVLLRPGPARKVERGHARLKDLLAIRSFRRIFLAHALAGFSFMIPFVYLVPFARNEGIEAQTAAWLLATMGLSGVAGRVVLGWFGDRFGAIVAITIATAGMALGTIVWAVSSVLAGLFVVAVVYGFFAGAYAALVPAVTAQYLGIDDFASVVGGVYSGSALGMLIAPPLVGAIFDSTGSYLAGILASLGVLVVVLAVFVRLRATEAIRTMA